MYDKIIKRSLQNIIQGKLFSGKTIILLGPRQVGKTTLLKQIADKEEAPIIWINGDVTQDRELLNNISGQRARELFPTGTIILIDEALRFENTGLTLKIIHDHCENIQLIATGSSSFELADKIKESLTGRKWSYKLHPFSQEELVKHFGLFETTRQLETRLIFGAYPEIINNAGNEKEILIELVSDYLYKDVFALKDIRKPEGLEKLVQAIAYQLGNQVSFRELSQLTGLDKETVERYIRLLEEAFIIFRLPSYARNLRSELSHSRKIYFTDNGIRNSVISQFNHIAARNDVGALWENFLVSERRKLLDYNKLYRNTYFWRTTRQQEIDYLEEFDGNLYAYEFKWNPKRKVKFSKSFTQAYPHAYTIQISKDNFTDFVLYKN